VEINLKLLIMTPEEKEKIDYEIKAKIKARNEEVEQWAVISCANGWWVTLTDLKKVLIVKELYGYEMDAIEIRKNISINEIEEMYYLRNLLNA
jgi:hypothetical protein